MNELVISDSHLPANIEDLSRFVLIGTEKLNAVRAEIRAIKKVGMAKEVYEQKMEEQRQLSYAILDASVKLGEFTQKIPAQPGQRNDRTSALHSAEVEKPKTKAEIIKDLGFNHTQVTEFETLAKNPGFVEQAKQEAIDKGEPVSRTKVVDFIREKNRKIIDNPDDIDPTEYIDFCKKAADHYRKAIYGVLTVPATEEYLNAWLQMLDGETVTPDLMISKINEAIHWLNIMRSFLINNKEKVNR